MLDLWKSIPSHTGKVCPDNVVSGDGNNWVGTCARTDSTSSNKLISYVCDVGFYSYNYICQKRKQGK